MKFNSKKRPLILATVGSSLKLGINDSDLDLRGFYIEENIFSPFYNPNQYEWRSEENRGGRKIDTDGWHFQYAIRQILRGDNSCPLLYSCLFSNDYQVENRELIENRDKLRSENLIKGTLKFCDQKIKTSQRPSLKHHKEKYVYYALSDMFEALEIAQTKNCIYPLRFSESELKLVLALKNNTGGYEEGVAWYKELRCVYEKSSIQNEIDLEWIEDFSERLYV